MRDREPFLSVVETIKAAAHPPETVVAMARRGAPTMQPELPSATERRRVMATLNHTLAGMAGIAARIAADLSSSTIAPLPEQRAAIADAARSAAHLTECLVQAQAIQAELVRLRDE